ncbi:lysis protein [Arsenophonus nasoniae]|uniref:Lysis protein n=1 Tax=Arsenophonus nasoniae TaxID=638 RepID=A0AA95KCM8_9GAMM|nr:lysis protein [Arsenophonus nasoniae]WGM00638.1 lysis protein [Arsenophonus nasoniae]
MLWRPHAFVVVIIVALNLVVFCISSRYQTVKQNYQTLKQQYQAQLEAVKLQQQKIDSLQKIDSQHTEELSNAKAEITKLHDAVRAGTKRLRIKTLRETPKPTTTESRHDEASPQLSASAREDYFRLRAMIVENEKQTEYLQQYIKTQCQ